MAKPKLDYRSLSVPERLDLVEDIWDSIAQDAESLELTPEERAELDRRLAEHERDPSSAIPWKTVKDELFRRGGLRRASSFGQKRAASCSRPGVGTKNASQD